MEAYSFILVRNFKLAKESFVSILFLWAWSNGTLYLFINFFLTHKSLKV